MKAIIITLIFIIIATSAQADPWESKQLEDAIWLGLLLIIANAYAYLILIFILLFKGLNFGNTAKFLFTLALILYSVLILYKVWFYSEYTKQRVLVIDKIQQGDYGLIIFDVITLLGFFFVSSCLFFQKKQAKK